jgi:hypothetical protein
VPFRECFEARWAEAVVAGASGALEPKVRALYVALLARPCDLLGLRDSLVRLLEYLTCEEGRTEANLCTVDAFVCLLTAERNELVERLPGEYQDVLDTMALDLRETLRDPELALQCGAVPELLLAQARNLGLPN